MKSAVCDHRAGNISPCTRWFVFCGGGEQEAVDSSSVLSWLLELQSHPDAQGPLISL